MEVSDLTLDSQPFENLAELELVWGDFQLNSRKYGQLCLVRETTLKCDCAKQAMQLFPHMVKVRGSG